MVLKVEAAFGLLSDYGNRIFLSELNMLDVGGYEHAPTLLPVAITSELNEVAVDSEKKEIVIKT